MTTEVQSPVHKSPFTEYMEEQLEILARENDSDLKEYRQ